MELRDYQRELVELGLGSLRNGERPVLALPTGAGKTEVAIALVRESGYRQVSFVTPNKHLVGQTAERFEGAGIRAVSNWKPGMSQVEGAVMVCTMPSFINRRAKGLVCESGLVVVDEGHHYSGLLRKARSEDDWEMVKSLEESGRYDLLGFNGEGKAVGWYRTGKWTAALLGLPSLVGLTATPWRLGKHDRMLGYPWTELICGPDYGELRDGGWLADYRLGAALVQDGIKRVRNERMGMSGDGDNVDTAKTWEQADEKLRLAWTEGAVDVWEREAEGRLTVCFALGVDHAGAVSDAFNGRGIRAEVVTGDTDNAERREVLERFNAGEVRVLVNVGVFREGFDCQEASVLLCLRPTGSLTLWRQMLGRVLRPKRDGSKALILDLTDNRYELENEGIPYLPDSVVEWDLMEREVKGAGECGEKMCDNGHPNHPAARACVWDGCECVFGGECPRCREWQYTGHYRGAEQDYRLLQRHFGGGMRWDGRCGLCVAAEWVWMEAERALVRGMIDQIEAREREKAAAEQERLEWLEGEWAGIERVMGRRLEWRRRVDALHWPSWSGAKTGNGFNAMLAGGRIWVGTMNRRRVVKVDIEHGRKYVAEGSRGRLEQARERVESALGLALRRMSFDEFMDGDWGDYLPDRNFAALNFAEWVTGVLCGSCGVRRHLVSFRRCVSCQRGR